MVLEVMPTAVLLLQLMGVGGWGCPISSRVSRIFFASSALRKRAPSSASATDAALRHTLEPALPARLQCTGVAWSATGRTLAASFGRRDIVGWCDVRGCIGVWNIFDEIYEGNG